MKRSRRPYPIARGRKCPSGRRKVCGGRGKNRRCVCVLKK